MAQSPPALQVSHASGLHAVAHTLESMHREVLRAGGGDENGTVRLSTLNLVAACTEQDAADLASQTVGRLGERNPARAIIIVAHPESAEQIEADLSVQYAVTAQGQISAEQIRLTVGGEPAYHLASVVTPLLIPDVPVFLWLVGAPPLRQAFGQDAVAICERLILDSGAYTEAAETLRTLASEMQRTGGAVDLADITWERIRPWRQLIAQAFEGPEMRPMLDRVTRVEVTCSGDSITAQGWLLAGWLGARLGWRQPGGPSVAAAADPSADIPEGELHRVRVDCVSGEATATVEVRRSGRTMQTVVDIDGGLRASAAMPLPEVETIDVVAELLEEGSADPLYAEALGRATTLAGRRTR